MNYFTESVGWISYVMYGSTEPGISQARHYPRSGEAAGWDDPNGRASEVPGCRG